MKKTYKAPILFVVELNTHSMYMNLSAGDTLGAAWGGETNENGIIEANAKAISDNSFLGKSIWDEEW